MKLELILVSFFISNLIYAQSYQGFTIEKNTGNKVNFVNIGVVGKNNGTVSNESGKYSLTLDSTIKKTDILKISKIGYTSIQLPISELKDNQNFELQTKSEQIAEIRIKPRVYKEKLLGNFIKSKIVGAGFTENNLGKEVGVLMKAKKTAYLKEVQVNLNNCAYDTIYYRLNITEVGDNDSYTNILREPIYVILPKEAIKETLIIDLRDKNIVTNGNFIVSLEHIKDLGKGGLYFCSSLLKKSYIKSTSQGEWERVPVGVSIGVLADVEQ